MQTDAEHHNSLCIWIYINSHAVPKIAWQTQVKHALSVHVFGKNTDWIMEFAEDSIIFVHVGT